MVNEALEQRTEGAKRLLVVEDKPKYALEAVRAAKSRGYQVDVAFDLEDALTYLADRKYDGVLTDMTFRQRGIGKLGVNDEYPFLKKEFGNQTEIDEFGQTPELYTAFQRALNKNSKGTDKDLREIVTKESVRIMTPELLEVTRDKMIHTLRNGVEDFKKEIVTYNSEEEESMTTSNPALGYFVVKKSQERGIPVVISTMTSHAAHAVPAVLATGLVDTRELMKHLEYSKITYKLLSPFKDKKINDFTTEVYRAEIRFDLLGIGDLKNFFPGLNEELISLSLDDPDFYRAMHKRLLSTERLMRKLPFVFDKVIVDGKYGGGYNLSIDQLEGKIEQTRPYRLLTQEERMEGFSLSRDLMREKLGLPKPEPVKEVPKEEPLPEVKSIETIQVAQPSVETKPKKSFWGRIFG